MINGDIVLHFTGTLMNDEDRLYTIKEASEEYFQRKVSGPTGLQAVPRRPFAGLPGWE